MYQVKKTRVIVIAFLLAMVVGWASVASAKVEVEGDAYIGVFDKYLWRGFDLSGSKPVVQGGVDLSVGGFTLSYWSNMQLSSDVGEDLRAGELNETDVILDYSFDVGDLMSMSVGNMFYALDGVEDTNEAYLAVALNTLLSPSLTVYWNWDGADESGLFYVLSASHGIEISKSFSLNLSASCGYNQESDYLVGDYNGWHNAEFSVGFDYMLTEQVTLSPSFLYSTPLSDNAEDISGIDDETVAGLNITFIF